MASIPSYPAQRADMSGLMQFSRPASATSTTRTEMPGPLHFAGAASMCALYGSVGALRRLSTSPASVSSQGAPSPFPPTAISSSLAAQRLAEDEAAAVSGLFAVAAGGSPRVASPTALSGDNDDDYAAVGAHATHVTLGKRPRSARAAGAAVPAVETSRDLVGCVRAGIDTQVLTADMLTQVAATYFFVTPTIRDAMISSAVSRAIAETNTSRDSLSKEVLVSLHTYANRRYRELLRNRTMRDVAGTTGASVIAAVEAFAEQHAMSAVDTSAVSFSSVGKAGKSGRVAMQAGAAVAVRGAAAANANEEDQPSALAHARMLVEAMLSMASHATEGNKLFACFHDRVLRVVHSQADWSEDAKRAVASSRRVFLLCAISARMVPGSGVSLYSQLSELLVPEHKDVFPACIRDSKGVRTFQHLLDAVARYIGTSRSPPPDAAAPVVHSEPSAPNASTASYKRPRRAPAGSTGGLGDLLAASALVSADALVPPPVPEPAAMLAPTVAAPQAARVTVTMEPEMLQRLLAMIASTSTTSAAVPVMTVHLNDKHQQ